LLKRWIEELGLEQALKGRQNNCKLLVFTRALLFNKYPEDRDHSGLFLSTGMS
jgi:hypothetical protein